MNILLLPCEVRFLFGKMCSCIMWFLGSYIYTQGNSLALIAGTKTIGAEKLNSALLKNNKVLQVYAHM